VQKPGTNLFAKIQLQVKPFGFDALAKYELNDTVETAQLIFFRNMEIAFQFRQILISLCGFKSTAIGKAKKALCELELTGERVTSGRSINFS
jgi:hypothetical protein